MNSREEFEKNLIDGVRKTSMDNGWDDLLTLEESDLLKVSPLMNEDEYFLRESTSSNNDSICMTKKYTECINELLSDIDYIQVLLNKDEINSFEKAELRSDLCNLERKMAECNRKIDDLKNKYDGRNR